MMTLAAIDAVVTSIAALLIAFLGGGGLVALIKARPETDRIMMDREAILEGLQQQVLARVKDQYADMGRELDQAKLELAHARRQIAERDLKIEILSGEMIRLHDEVAALRLELGLTARPKKQD